MTTLSEQTVQTVVEPAIAGTIESCTVIDKGTDIIYRLTATEDGQKAPYYFKTADQNHTTAFQSEPLIQHYINTHTSLPTADIVALDLDGSDTPLNRPYFVMRGLPGDHPTSNWEYTDLKRVAHQMGETLGEIHDTITFDTAAEVYAETDSATTLHHLAEQESAITFATGKFDSWADMILESARDLLTEAEEPFDAYADEIIQYYDAHSGDLPTDEELSLTLMHGDYRFDNVLFERTPNATLSGVLDWGRVVAGDRRYNLIRTAYLFDRAFEDESMRNTMRGQLYEGYNTTNKIAHDSRFVLYKPLYTLHVMAVEFKWFSQWYAGKSEEWKQTRQQYLIDTVEELLGSSTGR